MPNDVPDWTAKNQTQLVGQDPTRTPLGDLSIPGQDADQVTEQITTYVAINQAAQVIASIKAAAGSTIAPVGAAGPLKTGTATSVSPLFGQATVAGHYLAALVTSPAFAGSLITTAAAGWAVVKDLSSQGGAAIWAKPNCGNGEAAPTFTCGAGGSTPMLAQLVEFSGAATASPTDKTASANPIGAPSTTATMSQKDTGTADLVLCAVAWLLVTPAKATFTDIYNNLAAGVNTGNTGLSGLGQHASFSYAIIPLPPATLPMGVAPWPYDVMSYSTPATGSLATVTLAANLTKGYIVAFLSACVVSTTAVASGLRRVLLSGGGNLFQTSVSTPAILGQADRYQTSDLAIPAPDNTAVTLAFDTNVANIAENCAIGAYLR